MSKLVSVFISLDVVCVCEWVVLYLWNPLGTCKGSLSKSPAAGLQRSVFRQWLYDLITFGATDVSVSRWCESECVGWCVWVCVWVWVCVCVCVWVCVWAWVWVCVCVSVCGCVSVCVSVSVGEHECVCECVWAWGCVYVWVGALSISLLFHYHWVTGAKQICLFLSTSLFLSVCPSLLFGCMCVWQRENLCVCVSHHQHLVSLA